jgi:hypothetical protein
MISAISSVSRGTYLGSWFDVKVFLKDELDESLLLLFDVVLVVIDLACLSSPLWLLMSSLELLPFSWLFRS